VRLAGILAAMVATLILAATPDTGAKEHGTPPAKPRVIVRLPVAVRHTFQLAVEATSYCLVGRTKSGHPAGPGSIAVDPSLIPMGSHITVPGYGNGTAEDTGSAILGHHIDVWLPPSSPVACPRSDHWGVRHLLIQVTPPPGAPARTLRALADSASEEITTISGVTGPLIAGGQSVQSGILADTSDH